MGTGQGAITAAVEETGMINLEQLCPELMGLLGTGKIGIWQLDLSSQMLSMRGGENLLSLFGDDRASTTRTLEAFLRDDCHPDDVPALREDLRDMISGDHPYNSEFRIWNTEHMEWRWANVFGKKYTGPGGSVLIMGGMQDINDRKTFQRAISEIREAEERTQIMLDATPLCCNFWDSGYNNIDCNQEAANLFCLADKREYLSRFNDLSPEYQPDGGLSSEKAREKIKQAFDTGRCRFEWMHQKLDGEPVPAEITLVRVKWRDSYIVVGYTRDLRKVKAMLAEMDKTQDELRRARDLAEESARAKSEFLANMSHEIRTPMNAILGMTHLLLKMESTQKQRYYLEKAEQSAKLLLRIVNDILDFSKIEAGKLEMENIGFSVSGVLRDVSEVVARSAAAKDLDFSAEADPNIPASVLGDALRLNQVLLNLVNNAIKFTEKGYVKVRVREEKRLPGRIKLLFSVQDTGIGLEEEQINGLFTPFTQADSSITRKYGGTGLGLAISMSLVGLMGGKIWCESAPGRGTTFYFTAAFGLLPEGRDESVRSPVDGIPVLLTGDDPAALAAAAAHLKLLQCPVIETAHGLEALDDLANIPGAEGARLVLMDWEDADAPFAALQKLRAFFAADMPPVLCTAEKGNEAAERMLAEVGVRAILHKPGTLSSLYDGIAEALGGGKTRDKGEDAAQTAREALPEYLKGARILLAEDNEINQIFAVELLKLEGFGVDVANNGNEALELLGRGDYDLILMDIQMPEMDGLEAAKRIREMERHKDIPIIAMTAHAMTGDRELSLRAGMNDHVTKPIDPDVLYGALKKWIKPKNTDDSMGGRL